MIKTIVKHNLCTGCGVCISEDKSKTAKMVWNEQQFLVPSLTQASTQNTMSEVCPFNDKNLNEDKIGEILFKKDSQYYNDKIGYYNGLFLGYSKRFRETSSSGGIATYIFEKLLTNKIVDGLFVVQENNGEYEYKLCNNIADICSISKTRYTPVTLENLFIEIEKFDGKVAVSGVACFVKAIRLKQEKYPELKKKIPFVVGIICGGLKSKYYTDFLSQSAGCYSGYTSAQYRIKKPESFALDYQFSCENRETGRIHMVDMLSLGDMWGTGYFKSNACDFCDDVVTELADISLGDAWIEPYNADGLGNSIMIARSELAYKMIEIGWKNQELHLDKVAESAILQSQSGSYNHRHRGLKYRIDKAQKQGSYYPQKRSRFIQNQNILINFIQSARLKTRANSLKIWHQYQDVSKFNTLIRQDRERLELANSINRKVSHVVNILKKMIRGNN